MRRPGSNQQACSSVRVTNGCVLSGNPAGRSHCCDAKVTGGRVDGGDTSQAVRTNSAWCVQQVDKAFRGSRCPGVSGLTQAGD